MRLIKLTTAALILAMSTTLISCDQKTIIPDSKIPSEIKSYVSTHFPNNAIIQATKEIDGITKTYDIILQENIGLEFNRKKEIVDIDGSSALPNSVIPERLLQHVTANFPNNVITAWELDDKRQKIKLDNGLELEFNKKGDFLRLDD